MVVFDASVLIDLFNDRISGDRRARLDYLVETITQKRTKVLVPTPALSEFMAKAGKAREAYFQKLSQSSQFRIAPFGNKAAMECALLLDGAKTSGDKRNEGKTWAKAKFDWQIAAIAKSEGAAVIYSEDGDLARLAARLNLSTVKIDDLPIPDAARQRHLDLQPAATIGGSP